MGVDGIVEISNKLELNLLVPPRDAAPRGPAGTPATPLILRYIAIVTAN